MLSIHVRQWIGDEAPKGDFEPPLRSRRGYMKELDERTDIYLTEYRAGIQESWDGAKSTQ